MLSLPSLSPPDCYTLWYTSSSSPNPKIIKDEDDQNSVQAQHHNQNRSQNPAYRSPLTNLRLDEESIRNRKKNITDYGAMWLKPPGVPKSLQQLREEEREMREHQETLRREQLAQELAEAGEGGELESFLQGEEGMEEMQDLDDEVPEADNSAFSTNDEVDSDDEETEQDDDLSGLETRNNLTMPDDMYRREALIHERLLCDDSSVLSEKELSGMLNEEDLIQERTDAELTNATMDMDRDMDLDDEIPEGDGYEHTDTEEEISSSEDEGDSFKFDAVGMHDTRS
ncbi:hypothetical protein Golomagni_03907 [Golovinomyces magnicellulatus]|nr:hypothetical protein Golomagni_03907 [Golovinomyces magnicellulatus]